MPSTVRMASVSLATGNMDTRGTTRTAVAHPDNLLGTGRLPNRVEKKLCREGIRFATQLQTSHGQPFLLCGQRCPRDAGADMLRDALRSRRNS